MSRTSLIPFMIFLIAMTGTPELPAQVETPQARDHVEGQVILKFRNEVSREAELETLELLGLHVIYRYPSFGAYWVRFDEKITVQGMIERLQARRDVRWVHENAIGKRHQSFPNDPSFNSSYAMHNTGQSIAGFPGANDADLDGPEAWATRHDASNVILALVDSGCRMTHQDLAANIWVNSGEIAGNGVDDDGNGFIDDINGWDFLGNDNSPTDLDGHGTNVAGSACARGNNGVGTAGPSWEAQAMILKDGDAGPQVALSAQAIEYAAMNGATVANFSTGYGSGSYPALQAAVNTAQSAGMIIVVAAGNDGSNINNSNDAPATYTNDNLIVVAATNNQDQLTNWSTRGNVHVDVAAPGEDVYTTNRNSNTSYGFASGTSFSAPIVTGCVALMRAHSPGTSYQSIRSTLISTCDPKASLNGQVASNGRVNLDAALTALGGGGGGGPIANFTAAATSGTAPFTATFSDSSSGTITTRAWSFGDGGTSSQTNPTHVYAAVGSYTVALTVTGPSGSNTQTRTGYITVVPAGSGVLSDGSFEGQTAGAAPTTPWSQIAGSHTVLPTGSATDGGFPTDGSKWCELTCTGSNAATPPAPTNGIGTPSSGANGISVAFNTSNGGGILEFDAAFISAEAPNEATYNDFMTVEVSDGSTSATLYYADTFSALGGNSAVHGLPMTAATPVSIDLATLFPSATSSTTFTVRANVGNGGDDFFDSFGYVDNFRVGGGGGGPTLAYPGTGEDLVFESAVNGASLTDGIGQDVKTVQPGDSVLLRFQSPGSAFVNSPYAVLATFLDHTGGQMLPIIAGIDGLYGVSGETMVVQVPLGPALLPAGGLTIGFTWPGFAGADVMLQALVSHPLAANGFAALTNGHVLED